MQPSPSAETSRLLFPSLRFCIASPSSQTLTSSARPSCVAITPACPSPHCDGRPSRPVVVVQQPRAVLHVALRQPVVGLHVFAAGGTPYANLVCIVSLIPMLLPTLVKSRP